MSSYLSNALEKLIRHAIVDVSVVNGDDGREDTLTTWNDLHRSVAHLGAY